MAATNMAARASISVDEYKTMSVEAEEAIKEVRFAVTSVDVSSKLQNDKQVVYLNLTTKENETYCVQLSIQGYRIVGRKYDKVDEKTLVAAKFYETIYALLDSISPEYRLTFGETLIGKLAELQQEQEETDVFGN